MPGRVHHPSIRNDGQGAEYNEWYNDLDPCFFDREILEIALLPFGNIEVQETGMPPEIPIDSLACCDSGCERPKTEGDITEPDL